MAKRDQYTIRRGKIQLFRRDAEGTDREPSDNWYAAFKIPGMRAIQRSLKTEYEDEAEARAEDMYQELLHRHKKGLSFSTKRFGLVAKDYQKHFEKQVETREALPNNQKYKLRRFTPTSLARKTRIIEKQLIPYFGDKLITDITKHDVDEFKTQRQFYWITGEGAEIEEISFKRGRQTITRPKLPAERSIISHTTVNKELTVMREVYEFAKDKRLLSEDEIPKIVNVEKPPGYDEDHATPELSEEELKKLLNTIGKRYHFQTNPKHRLAHKRLGLYIAIMASTGMRVTEAKKVRFNDCKLIKNNGQEYLAIYVWGKGKQRETIPLRACKKFIDQMRKHHIKNAKEYGWTFSEDMLLFMDQYGNPIGSFTGPLNRTLQEAGLLRTPDGRKRNAMSFRPTFITLALSKGEMSHMQLAINMGTSVEMIEKHYNQMKSRHIPERLQFETTLNQYFDE